MFETADSIWFATRIRLLNKRASDLLVNIKTIKGTEKLRVEKSEKELNTCCALLEQLIDYAEHNKVMSSEDYQLTKQTESNLQKCQEVIESKKLTWWQNVFNIISNILPHLSELLGALAAYLYERNPRVALLVAGISKVIGFLPSAKI